MRRELFAAERLLLAQAAYEYGAEDWSQIAKILARHPLISRPKSFFTAQSCNAMYTNLMNDAGLDSTAEPNTKPKAPLNLKLAQIHYQARFLELRELIIAEESAFKTVLQEIEDIKGGLWDDRIKADLGIQPETVALPEAAATEPSDVRMAYEEARSPSEPSQLTSFEDDSQMDQSFDVASVDMNTQEMGDETMDPDPEEHEVSMQLTPAILSPPSSQILPAAGPSLVPSYTDRDSSPSRDSPGTSPIPDSPKPTEHLVPEIQADDEAEEEHESASRAVSEEPLLMTTMRQAKGKKREKSTSATSEPSHQTDSPAPETVHSENATESPKPPSEADSGIQTRRGKRKAGSEAEYKRDKKKARSESEPGDDSEPAPTARKQRNNKADQQAARRFQNLIGLVHAQISQHRNGNIFHNPIKPSEAPDYADIVKRPMDLKTIKTRIKDGVITNSLEYQRDVYLMFVNSMMYNRPNSDIYNMAEDMMLESENHINTFRQTEGWNNR